MTFLQRLQAHKGGLIRLKTGLYWYDGVRNEIVDRICLLLDATTVAAAATTVAAPAFPANDRWRAAALLLIDGSPQWIWIIEADVEVINGR